MRIEDGASDYKGSKNARPETYPRHFTSFVDHGTSLIRHPSDTSHKSLDQPANNCDITLTELLQQYLSRPACTKGAPLPASPCAAVHGRSPTVHYLVQCSMVRKEPDCPMPRAAVFRSPTPHCHTVGGSGQWGFFCTLLWGLV